MKTILIADDDKPIRELVATVLGQSSSYCTLLAEDGEETLRLAREQRPDLIVLDIKMPKKSGNDVCWELKNDPATSNIKIIMVSALPVETGLPKALKSGADHYLSKPFSPTALLHMIGQQLDQT